MQAKILAQAHTQRAALLYAAAKDSASLPSSHSSTLSASESPETSDSRGENVNDSVVISDLLPRSNTQWDTQALEEAGANEPVCQDVQCNGEGGYAEGVCAEWRRGPGEVIEKGREVGGRQGEKTARAFRSGSSAGSGKAYEDT